jgi:hypothetical protein
MKELFADLLSVSGVKGVVLFSKEGEILYQEMREVLAENLQSRNWGSFINTLEEIREADLVFEMDRLYLRKSETGFLLVLMNPFVPIAMIRLNCDIILPNLKNKKSGKGLKRLFKR